MLLALATPSNMPVVWESRASASNRNHSFNSRVYAEAQLEVRERKGDHVGVQSQAKSATAFTGQSSCVVSLDCDGKIVAKCELG